MSSFFMNLEILRSFEGIQNHMKIHLWNTLAFIRIRMYMEEVKQHLLFSSKIEYGLWLKLNHIGFTIQQTPLVFFTLQIFIVYSSLFSIWQYHKLSITRTCVLHNCLCLVMDKMCLSFDFWIAYIKRKVNRCYVYDRTLKYIPFLISNNSNISWQDV